MKCEGCGTERGFAHICCGIAPPLTPEEAEPPPSGFAPVYYLRLAFHIVRWDDMAIRRAARDPNALVYGAVFSAITAAVVFLLTALPNMLRRAGATSDTVFWGLLLGLLYVWVSFGAIAIVQIGLCQFIAKWFLGAMGTFFGVIRPSLLGWFVNALTVIPVVGPFAAAMAWTAVLMVVLEEADGIGRFQAFLISAGINAIFLVLPFLLPHQ